MEIGNLRFVESDRELEEAVGGLAELGVIGISTKTTGLDPHLDELRLVALAGAGIPTVVADVRTLTVKGRQVLANVLGGRAVKVTHHGKFHLAFLLKAGIDVQAPIFDVALAVQLMEAGLPKKRWRLADLAKELAGVALPDELSNSDWTGPLSQEQLQYAAQTAEILLPLRDELVPRLTDAELMETVELEGRCIRATVRMELEGVLVDLVKYREESKRIQQQRRSAREQLRETADIDWDSREEVLSYLQSIGVQVGSLARDVLAPYAKTHPVVTALQDYQSVTARDLEKHIHPVTGRVHPCYQQLGTATGRFSVSSPNIQSVARGGARGCITARPGRLLVIGDYSQIQLRLLAETVPEPVMAAAFKAGQDIHTLTACRILHKSSVTEQERQMGKAINFGVAFGMWTQALQNTVRSASGAEISEEEARRFIDEFRRTYPGIDALQREVRRERYQVSISVGGRKRYWDGEGKYTELLVSPVQGTEADILKRALGDLVDVLQGTGAALITCVHDEIVLESPWNAARKVARLLEETMLKAARFYLKSVPVEVKIRTASSWGEESTRTRYEAVG